MNPYTDLEETVDKNVEIKVKKGKVGVMKGAKKDHDFVFFLQ